MIPTAVRSVLEVALTNALAASALTLIVALLSRRLRRPGLIHLLWIVVMLKLFAPPILEWGVLPQWNASVEGNLVASSRPFDTVETQPSVIPQPDSLQSSGNIAIGIWFAGSLSILCLALIRRGRFRTLERSAAPASGEIVASARRLARHFGLPRCPEVRTVEARISPMVWSAAGGPQILLPGKLMQRFTDAEVDAVLAHELAHVHRRDHWIRYLEFLAGCAFWWLPAVWWARRGLRRAEEQCCDLSVLNHLPGHAKAYARSLVKTVEYLAATPARLPDLASGIGEVHELKERVNMILTQRSVGRFTKAQRVLLAVVAGVVLSVFPIAGDQAGGDSEPAPEPQAEQGREYLLNLTRLESEADELEDRLLRIREQQRDLESEYRRMIESSEGFSDTERSREERVLSPRLLELERETQARDEMRRRVRDLEPRLQDLEREIAERFEQGELERVRELQDQESAVKTEIEHMLQRELAERELRGFETRLDHELRAESDRQRRYLDQLKAIESYQRARELAEVRKQRYDTATELMDESESLRDDGRLDEADQLRREAERLLRDLEQASESLR